MTAIRKDRRRSATVRTISKATALIAVGSLAAGLLATTGAAPTPAQAVAHAPGVSVNTVSQQVWGTDLAIDITFASAELPQHNRTAAVVLPTEVSLVDPGTLGAPLVYQAGETLPSALQHPAEQTCEALGLATNPNEANTCLVAPGTQYLVFQGFETSAAESTHTLLVRPNTAQYGIGSTLNYQVNGYAANAAGTFPVFPGSTSPQGDTSTTTLATTVAQNLAVSGLRITQHAETVATNKDGSPAADVTGNIFAVNVYRTAEAALTQPLLTTYLPEGVTYLGSCGSNDERSIAYRDYAASLDPAQQKGGSTSVGADCFPETSITQVRGILAEDGTFTADENGSNFTQVTWDLTEAFTAPGNSAAQQFPDTAGQAGMTTVRYRVAAANADTQVDLTSVATALYSPADGSAAQLVSGFSSIPANLLQGEAPQNSEKAAPEAATAGPMQQRSRSTMAEFIPPNQPYIAWVVEDANNMPVGGATFDLRRTDSDSTRYESWSRATTVVDCTSESCANGVGDIDPRPGHFAVAQFSSNRSISNDRRYGIMQLNLPVAWQWGQTQTDYKVIAPRSGDVNKPALSGDRSWPSSVNGFNFGSFLVQQVQNYCIDPRYTNSYYSLGRTSSDNAVQIERMTLQVNDSGKPSVVDNAEKILKNDFSPANSGSANALGVTETGVFYFTAQRNTTSGRFADVYRYDPLENERPELADTIELGNSAGTVVSGDATILNGKEEFYFAYYENVSGFLIVNLHRYSENDSSRSGKIAKLKVTRPAGFGTSFNGDFSFDAQDNLHFIISNSSSDNSSNNILSASLSASLFADLPVSSTKEIIVENAFAGKVNDWGINGVTFTASGYAVLQKLSGSTSYNGVTTLPDFSSTSMKQVSPVNLVDLASCAKPPTVTVFKNVAGPRSNVGDSFTLNAEHKSSGSTPKITKFNPVTTGSIVQGIQPEILGPVVVTLDGTFRATETINNRNSIYKTTWDCVAHTPSGETISVPPYGAGMTNVGKELVINLNNSKFVGANIECTFTNEGLSWNIEKTSQVHENDLVPLDGNVSYTVAVKKAGPAEQVINGIRISDDMSEVMAVARIAPIDFLQNGDPAFSVKTFTSSGVVARDFANASTRWDAGDIGFNKSQLYPQFQGTAADAGNVSPSGANWKWQTNIPAFSLLAGEVRAEITYTVNVGGAARTTDPTQFQMNADQIRFPAANLLTFENTVWGAATTTPPTNCTATTAAQDPKCNVEHQITDLSFEIQKNSVVLSGDDSVLKLTGAEFMIRDSALKAGWPAGSASANLCHTNYKPVFNGGVWSSGDRVGVYRDGANLDLGPASETYNQLLAYNKYLLDSGLPQTPMCANMFAVTSGEAESWDVQSLAAGSYELVETTAPDQHQLLGESIPFVVHGANTQNQLDVLTAHNSNRFVERCDAQTPLPANGSLSCVEEAGFLLNVFDPKYPTLPLAGGAGFAWLTVGGITALIAALGGTAWFKRRQKSAASL